MKQLTRDETEHGQEYYLAAEVDALLAQPAQEPVAFICQGNLYMAGDVDKYCTATHIPLYSAPPQRPWIWLSDADIRETIDSICQYSGDYDEWLCKKIERKIRSMNNG